MIGFVLVHWKFKFWTKQKPDDDESAAITVARLIDKIGGIVVLLMGIVAVVSGLGGAIFGK